MMQNKINAFFKGAAIGCLLFLSLNLKAQHRVKFVSEDEQLPIAHALLKLYVNNDIYTYSTDVDGYVNLPGNDFPLIFSFKHVAYADSGQWQAYPEIVIIKRRVINVNEARVQTSNSSSQQQDVLIVVRMALPHPGTSPVSLSLLHNFNGASLSNALNAIPGVRFDERGQGGSRRLNIRGNYVRSAFGVRGIPMYFDNIPLSGPEGSTPLEVLDQELIESINIHKGVSRVYASSANGGAMMISPAQIRYPGSEVFAGVTAGSYNYVRQVSGYMWSDSKHSLIFRQIHQQTDGYREQESNRKDQFYLQYRTQKANNNGFTFTSMYYKGDWDLPGSISEQELSDNPQMARPYSLSVNASVEKKYLLNALTYRSVPYAKTKHETTIFINNNDKINPYGTSPFFSGYKDEKSVVTGWRTYAESKINDFSHIMYGGELQHESGKYLEYTNNKGEKGDLKYNNKTRFTSGNIYASYYRLFRGYIFNLGLNAQLFDFNNTGYSEVLDSSLISKKFYKPVVLPAIEIKKKIFTNSQIYLVTKRGNSWPGLFELVDVETGYINRNLGVENNLIIESGISGYSDKQVGYEFNIYSLALRNPILPGIDTLERISYYNGNDSRYFGAEFTFSKLIKFERIVQSIYIAANGSIQRYYADKNMDLLMPGVPLSTAGLEIKLNHKKGFQLQLLHRYTDKLPLNDDNSRFLAANNIIHANLTWTKKLNHINIQLLAGVNNLSNTNYTAFPQLNATFGRYYNPAALRNYYGGIRIMYQMIKQ